MLSWHNLQNRPRALRTFTGLDKKEFLALLMPFEQAWTSHVETHYIQHKSRRRRYGGGRKPRLASIEDKLLFILVYVKLYPLQEVMGLLFAMSQGRANVWIHQLQAVLQSALGNAWCLPERKPQHLEQVLALCTSLDVVIDGTERRIRRPKEALKQRTHYSGKKKPTP